MLAMAAKDLDVIKRRNGIGTLKTATAYLGNGILRFFRDNASYVISIWLGPARTLRLCMAIFKFRCRHNLFFGKTRSFWAGNGFKRYLYKITDVDPATVKYEVKGGIVPYIEDGDWDLKKREINIYATVKELFIDNIPVQDTAQYRRMMAAVKRGKKAYWCRTPEEVDAYFRILLDTYRDIKDNGYRSHIERQAKPRGYYPDEILLAIDRHGDYLLESGGTHRLSIAKLLGIKSVPAVIIRKHYLYIQSKEDWLE